MTISTGVDVSGWQAPPHAPAPIDWTRARADGVSFAAIKATEGTGFVDPSYHATMQAARAAAVPCLFAMHFLWPGEGAAQADHFVATVGNLSDVGVLLDVEKNGSGTWPAYADVDAFISRLVDHHGFTRPGVIYTGAWFWAGRGYLADPKAPWGWPLWDSRYTAPVGLGLAAGAADANIDWTPGYGGWQSSLLVQFTDAARVAGIGTRVDGDAFRGSVAELRAAIGLLPETSTEDTMTITRVKAEDWRANGTTAQTVPFRDTPDRAAPVTSRAAAGEVVRTIAEVATAAPAPNGDWRLTERAGKPAYAMRLDLTPLVQGGDPATDARLTALIARQDPREYHIDADVTSTAPPVVSVTQA